MSKMKLVGLGIGIVGGHMVDVLNVDVATFKLEPQYVVIHVKSLYSKALGVSARSMKYIMGLLKNNQTMLKPFSLFFSFFLCVGIPKTSTEQINNE